MLSILFDNKYFNKILCKDAADVQADRPDLIVVLSSATTEGIDPNSSF